MFIYVNYFLCDCSLLCLLGVKVWILFNFYKYMWVWFFEDVFFGVLVSVGIGGSFK